MLRVDANSLMKRDSQKIVTSDCGISILVGSTTMVCAGSPLIKSFGILMDLYNGRRMRRYF